ncbi:ATP-binding protein [Sphaerisporangium siamense]|uniref:Anti-sigma regulatory factor (Ser/Thr protein kinase) n=1 Tax=Sphaerisporangium siamense TaxID=795645 RepID=A0A7W7GEL5_9ACTN|nr:ATP-binding protein [Sphaerisporangium siamense]MBB4704126.1 anti-sigma regulatory factor (Ser/Thr protein kinase) [Sphaerisporangium siamense]
MGRLLGVIELAGEPRSAGMAREFARDKLGDGHPVVDSVVLLVSEVVTNSVVHSNSRNGGKVTVALADCHDFVHVDVVDAGGEEAPRVREDESGEGGRGLHIVQALASSWGVRQDLAGRTVWFQVAYEYRPAALPLLPRQRESPESGETALQSVRPLLWGDFP